MKTLLKRLFLLVLMCAGFGQFSTAAPDRSDGDQGAKSAIFANVSMQQDFAINIAPANVMASFSDEDFLQPTADAPRFRDDGKNFSTDNTAVSVPTSGPGGGMRPNSNYFTEDGASVQNSTVRTATTQGSWQRVICDYNSVANSANSYHATITSGDFHDDVGQLFSQNFNYNGPGDKTCATG